MRDQERPLSQPPLPRFGKRLSLLKMRKRMQNRQMRRLFLSIALGWALTLNAPAQKSFSLEQAVALARTQNPEIIMARKQIEAARGGIVEARAGTLPSLVSSGLLRKRNRQEVSRLREEDYNASLHIVQSLYSGGAVRSR